MTVTLEIPEGMKPYAFSVVGIQEMDDDNQRIHNVCGSVASPHDEYARRTAVQIFNQHNPSAKIVMVTMTLIDKFTPTLKATS